MHLHAILFASFASIAPISTLANSGAKAPDATSCFRDTTCSGRELCIEGLCAIAPDWEEACKQNSDCANSERASCVAGVCKLDLVVYRRGGDMCVYEPGVPVSHTLCGHNGGLVGSVDPNLSDEEGFENCKGRTIDRCGASDGSCTPTSQAFCEDLVDLTMPFYRKCYASDAAKSVEMASCCWAYVNDALSQKRHACYLSQPKPGNCREFESMTDICSPFRCDDDALGNNETVEATLEINSSETIDCEQADDTRLNQKGEGGGCTLVGGPPWYGALAGIVLAFFAMVRRRQVGVTLALLLITLGGFAACDDSGKDKQGGENATSDECTQDCASDHDAEASTGDAGCQESGESTKELLEEIRQICFEACDEHVDCPDFDADRCEYKACGLDLNYLFGDPRGNCWEEGRLCFECYKAATCTELDDEDACAEHCDLVDDLCSSR